MKIEDIVEQCLKECVGEKSTDRYRISNSNISIPVVFVEKLVELVIGDILSIIEDMDDGSRDSYNITIQDVKRKIINWREND
jgi:hypothetical protein